MFDFLSQKFSSLFSHFDRKKLTQKDVDSILVQVKEALLEADVPYDIVESFAQLLNDQAVGQKIIASLKPSQQFLKIVHDTMVSFLGGENARPFTFNFPGIVMVMGLQGSGKTTTVGKLAYKIKKDKASCKIVLGSVDFYRPAAIDQLEILAQKVGVSFYRAQSTDPIVAAQEIYNYYKKNKYDIALLDTAGRMHVDSGMLQELCTIESSIQPSHKLLVLDAMTGQESLTVAKAFNGAVGFQAAILTKMDSDTRGGAAFAFRYALQKPIIFIGEGEKMDDLVVFHPDRATERMLGMGDIRSLIEQAEEKIAAHEQEKAKKALLSGRFTLQDFADQMAMINKVGSLSHIAKYIPGAADMVSPDMIQQGEVELKMFRAILSSMTLEERLDPRILNTSRKKRIAQGAGVDPKEIDILLKRFEEAKHYAKLLSKYKLF